MKTKLAIIFGGQSVEHEGSLTSAYNILRAVDLKKYDLLPIAITRTGEWWTGPVEDIILRDESFDLANFRATSKKFKKVSFILMDGKGFFDIADEGAFIPDVVFPLIHGQMGEDGSLQGLLDYAQLAYIGPDILGCTSTIDKGITKLLASEAGVAVAKFSIIKKENWTEHLYERLIVKLGSTMFLKPTNLGSSVSVYKVTTKAEFIAASNDIFSLTTSMLVEEFIDAREIECAVLGNKNPTAAQLGEVATTNEFYDYETKMYKLDDITLSIPADLSQLLSEKIKKIALDVYKVCNCRDLARIDFFLTKDDRILLNEINAIPGFADMSLFPLMWENAGKSKSNIIDELTSSALSRGKVKK